MLVYGPGRYRFGDFVKMGLPITVVLVGLVAFALPVLWPF
jgi:di/tricarboxylate transporter